MIQYIMYTLIFANAIISYYYDVHVHMFAGEESDIQDYINLKGDLPCGVKY